MSAYATSTETLLRIEFLSGRIIRQTKFYEETRNRDTFQSREYDMAEKRVLANHYLKQIRDEQRQNS